MKTAILVDGGFFIKRYRSLHPGWDKKTPEQVAKDLHSVSLKNLAKVNKKGFDSGYPHELYRIFFYDCPPLSKRAKNPVSGSEFDFKNIPESKFRTQFHAELKQLRKVALRLGRISNNGRWIIKPEKVKELLNGKIQISDLSAHDVRYDARQKGVDMRIGLDIASLAYKKSVDQIILVSGDSDFVPAAKLARREGIDFVLDPMWNHINPDLHEHIDGLVSCWPRPKIRKNNNSAG